MYKVCMNRKTCRCQLCLKNTIIDIAKTKVVWWINPHLFISIFFLPLSSRELVLILNDIIIRMYLYNLVVKNYTGLTNSHSISEPLGETTISLSFSLHRCSILCNGCQMSYSLMCFMIAFLSCAQNAGKTLELMIWDNRPKRTYPEVHPCLKWCTSISSSMVTNM